MKDGGEGFEEQKSAFVKPETSEENTGEIFEKENKDGDIGKLISAVEALITAIKDNYGQKEPETMDSADDSSCQDGEGCNDDSSDNKSQSMNNDAADDFMEKLNICRIGDRLNMTGLESKSVLEAKRAIVSKVLPSMRLDGKSETYIDAAYDIAVGEVNKRKDVSYQKRQMSSPAKRADSASNQSMALSARQRMIEREGGKENGGTD